MNRKGITTIELLLCFVIVMIITVSMYATVSAYNDRRIIESYKEQITNYKNTLTKDIQDDFIKIGVSSATYERTVTNSQYKTSLPKVMAVYTVNLELRDGSKRKLIIEQTLTKSSYHPAGYKASGGGQEVDDYFMIKYGDPDAMIEYKLPDLGSYTSEETGKTALDFSINNVLINIYDEKVLSIYIGFYHPEFGTRYCIDITALVDFSFTGAEFVNQKKVQFFILWNLNGGGYTGGLSPNPRGYDQTMLPLGPFTAPKLDNYTFTGWTGSNGTTPQMDYVIPRGTTGSLSFRANYRPNRLIFRYKLGAGEQLTPHTEKPSENKKFDWTVDADGYIKVSVNGGAVNYSQHVIDFTQTTLDLNNYNNTEGLNITKPAYVAVSGKQWKCLSGCLSTSVTLNQASGSVTPSSICNYKDADCNIALGVNWRPVDYTITYDYAGGNATNPATYNIETNTFTLNTPSRTGYDFAGWTGTGITGTASTVTITKGSTGDRSYTATWNIKKFNITYNANGGTGTMSPTTCNYNATCTLAANAFRKNGNTFAGWYTDASGGTKYGSTTTLTSNITVYAHWAPVEMEKTFDYTGNVVSYTIAAPGKYKFEVWGAQGGDNGESGGKGGYAVGYVNVTDTLTVYVVVGGRGGSDTACGGGGYNGGGNAGCNGTSGAGGGATHIAKTNRGVLSNYSSHKTDLYIVAGGGGGAGCWGCPGGYGGGSSGESKSGGGGTQSGGGSGGPAGSFGSGGSRNGDGGGGGGGYYGGGASSVDCGGGGGSGYVGGVTGGSTTGNQRAGNGYAKISFVE